MCIVEIDTSWKYSDEGQRGEVKVNEVRGSHMLLNEL